MNATVAQLVEHLLAKEEVAGSSPVCRSCMRNEFDSFLFCVIRRLLRQRKTISPRLVRSRRWFFLYYGNLYFTHQ